MQYSLRKNDAINHSYNANNNYYNNNNYVTSIALKSLGIKLRGASIQNSQSISELINKSIVAIILTDTPGSYGG